MATLKTDFSTWDRATLNRFAREAADALAKAESELSRPESTVVSIMRAENARLKAELAKPEKPERKPHTEADVQRIVFCAYETFGRKGFEDVVRETLGVPAPKETS